MSRFEKILSIPKSLYWNIRIQGFGGVKIPILFSYRTKIKIEPGAVIEIKKPRRFGVKIGFGGTDGIIENSYSYFKIGRSAKIVFGGDAEFAKGSSIRIDSGTMVVGNNFSCNKNCFFSCNEYIEFGKDVLLGWDVIIRDGDGHFVYKDKMRKNCSAMPIYIGDHVWIASYVHIMKGVNIADGCVAGYRSLITKCFNTPQSLIIGSPAAVKREHILWEK